jgi:hypothetical protein
VFTVRRFVFGFAPCFSRGFRLQPELSFDDPVRRADLCRHGLRAGAAASASRIAVCRRGQASRQRCIPAQIARVFIVGFTLFSAKNIV